MRWLILCVLLSSCSLFINPSPDKEGFMQEMEYNFPGSNREHNLEMGIDVCDKLRSGKTTEDVIMEKFDHGLTIGNSAIIVDSSIDFLCPEFK